jgi:phage-related protein
MAGMILYDGVDLNSVANVKIDDIWVSPISYDPVSRPRAIMGGSAFVRNRAGIRTVAVTFALLKDDRVVRQAALMAISEWAKTDKEYRLDIPGHPDHYLMGVCTSKPEPSLRQWWESKLRIVFTCYENPYWNSTVEKNVACGTPFYVLGDAPPLMRIERTLAASASDQSYTIGSNSMTFSTIPAGNMVIDLDRQTAVVGTTSIMQYYNVNSRFPVPKSGTVTVSGTGTVYYRERWQ